MARKIKESQPFSIRMEKNTFERLNKYCDEAGQSKTIAIERAINMYIDDYEAKQRKLEKVRE